MTTPDPVELHPARRFDWERIIRRCRIPGATKLVALVMATFADPDGGNVRPGEARLAAVCMMGPSTVRRHLAKLLGLGLLERLANGGGSRGEGWARAARYRLTIPSDLLERVEMLDPDDGTPLTQVSAVPPVDNENSAHSGERSSVENSAHSGERSSDATAGELRSLAGELRSFSGGNSAHLGEHLPAIDQPTDQPPSPTSGTSPTRASGDDEPRCPMHRRRYAKDGAALCGECPDLDGTDPADGRPCPLCMWAPGQGHHPSCPRHQGAA